jgi:hypothetical protein
MGSVVVPKDSLDLATVRRKAQVCASQPLYIPIRNWKIFQKYGKVSALSYLVRFVPKTRPLAKVENFFIFTRAAHH